MSETRERNRAFPGTKPVIPDSLPLWPAATLGMKIDVAVNEDSKIWVIHDKPFPDYLEWVEFDKEAGVLTFVTATGKIQDLGMQIHAPMDDFLAQAGEVCVLMVRDGQVRDMGRVPLTVQDYGLIVRKRK